MSKNFITSSQNESAVDSTKLLSSTIDLLRFPLAIMVIFIHMNPTVINLLEADFSPISCHGIYNIVGILGSHVLTHIAVPTFYLISGFLFFNNFHLWSWKVYKRKMQSRVKTLLIPYLLWNILPFILFVLAYTGVVILGYKPVDNLIHFVQEDSWHILYDYHEWGTTSINWLGDNLRMTGPYDLPLWFLRDLMVVTLLTPVLYYAIKKLKIVFLIFLFIAYISRIWTLVPGFSITAFFYFSTGAYFALNNLNIVSFACKYKYLFLIASAVLLVATTIYDGTSTIVGQNIYPFYVCSGVFTAFIIGSWCVRKYNMKPNKLLVSSCFFIYAFHGVSFGVSPISLICGVLHKVIPGTSGIENGICYLVTPFVTAIFCIATLVILRRFFPKFASLLSGNR